MKKIPGDIIYEEKAGEERFKEPLSQKRLRWLIGGNFLYFMWNICDK